jgi:hypothetical protein
MGGLESTCNAHLPRDLPCMHSGTIMCRMGLGVPGVRSAQAMRSQ